MPLEEERENRFLEASGIDPAPRWESGFVGVSDE
jgi:hypothetical protein